MLKHMMLGPARPKSLVAVFHGLGDGMHTMRPLAERWQAALPSTAFLLLQAPDRDYFQRVMLSGEWSGDWFSDKLRPAAAGETAEQAYVQTISMRCDHVNRELDGHLNQLGLGNEHLVYAGFSQGAALSAYAGLRRRCLGVLPLGGPCPPRPALLPENDLTRVCVVVGDKDPFAPYTLLEENFARYRCEGETDGVHTVKGLEHELSEASIVIGEAFLRSCLAHTDTDTGTTH